MCLAIYENRQNLKTEMMKQDVEYTTKKEEAN